MADFYFQNRKDEKMNKKLSLKERLDNFYGISKNGSSFKVEIIAGIATFLAMSYILIVNPNSMLWGGTSDPRWASLFIATALGAIIGTLLMSLLAKMPFAQASGMGLNATVGTIVGGAVGFSFTLGNALLLVLISGIIFLALTIVPCGKSKTTGKLISLREKIFEGIPESVRKAITVGIGLFIAYIGLQNAHIIVSDEYVISGFVDLTNKVNWEVGGVARTAVVGLFSFICIGILSHYKVKGAVIIGIFLATLLALPLQVTSFDFILEKVPGVTWKFWENFSTFFSMDPENGGVFFACFTEGFSFPEGSLATCIMLVITFCMIDMFDTMGTVVGCATNAGLIDEQGKPHNYNKIMYADSIATILGAGVGTSTVTTFVESGAGIAAGGKTGFTSLVTACLFFLSIFLLPLFAFIPSAACSGALMYVGVLMMANVKDIDFKNLTKAIPSFLTIIMMLLSYSITKGIGLGMIAYVFVNSVVYLVDLVRYHLSKNKEELAKPKYEVSVVALVVAGLFLVYFLVPVKF